MSVGKAERYTGAMIGLRTVLIALLPLLAVSAGPEEEYAARAAKLEGKKDAKAWLALADFAEEKILPDRREEALRKALEADPGNAAAHERLDEVLVGKEWLTVDEADKREIAQNEAKKLAFYGTKWMPAKEADKLREADRKAVGWTVEVRIDTAHLQFLSGRDLASTRRLARTLENEVDAYLRVYGKVWKMDPKAARVRVFLYPDWESYARDVRRMFGEEETNPAYYFNDTKTLYIAGADRGGKNDPERSQMIDCAHEMLHALDDGFAHVLSPFVPYWCQEGRAHHFGYSVRGLRILPGLVGVPRRNTLLKELSAGLESTPLSIFLSMNNQAFMDKNQSQNYAQAWAFVHFLLHGENGKHAAAFRKYLSGLPAKGNLAAFEASVGKASELQEPYARYAREVLIPLGKASQER